MIPSIRIDDVLQSRNFSATQIRRVQVRPMFEWFKIATENLQDRVVTLAIVAEGIDSQPEWVEYIKAHPKWIPQVHCWEHRNHKFMQYWEVLEQLKRAKYKIDETFNCNSTKFIPPRLYSSQATKLAAESLGLKEVRVRKKPKDYLFDRTIRSIFFHYWDYRDIKYINKIIKDLTLKKKEV